MVSPPVAALLLALTASMLVTWSGAPLILLCVRAWYELARVVEARVDTTLPPGALTEADERVQSRMRRLRRASSIGGPLDVEWARTVHALLGKERFPWIPQRLVGASGAPRRQRPAEPETAPEALLSFGLRQLELGEEGLARRVKGRPAFELLWSGPRWIWREVLAIAARSARRLIVPAALKAGAIAGAYAAGVPLLSAVAWFVVAAIRSVSKQQPEDLGAALTAGFELGVWPALGLAAVVLWVRLIELMLREGTTARWVFLIAVFSFTGVLMPSLPASLRGLPPQVPPEQSANAPSWMVGGFLVAGSAVMIALLVAAARDSRSRAAKVGWWATCFAFVFGYAAALAQLAAQPDAGSAPLTPPARALADAALVALSVVLLAVTLNAVNATVGAWWRSRHGRPRRRLRLLGVLTLWVAGWLVVVPTFVATPIAVLIYRLGGAPDAAAYAMLAVVAGSGALLPFAIWWHARRNGRLDTRDWEKASRQAPPERAVSDPASP